MASSSWIKWPDHERDKWRDDLRDIDFWLDGYSGTVAYYTLWSQFRTFDHVSWNIGVGAKASFTRAICSMVSKLLELLFSHMIKVDLKTTPTEDEALGNGIMSIKYQLSIAVAKKLGLLDQEYYTLKKKRKEIQYYTYGCGDSDALKELENHVRLRIVPQIGMALSSTKYLLVVENLQWPIELGSFTRDVGLPPPTWKDSLWFISTTSHDVYNKSKSKSDQVISVEEDDKVVLLTLFALCQSAKYIFNLIRQESNEYWHRIVIRCFHYAMGIFARHSQAASITVHELIHQWASQGILPRMSIKKEEDTSIGSRKCAYMNQVGRVILEAFQKYSLLRLPFCPTNEGNEAIGTGAQFLAYHGLIAEGITIDEISDSNRKIICFVGDHGWHVSREWLSPEETMGPTALILRACSRQSIILSKMDHFLPKLCFLRVLDLSYTTLQLLPFSISYLLNLRLLSLRGCHDLKTLFYSSTTSTKDSSIDHNSYSPLSTLCKLEILDMNGVPFSHLTQDMANQKRNLIYFDMSYSEVIAFPLGFFQDMPNLEELILVNCSNLVELPHSMIELSSLTFLEVAGTQLSYFPHEIFEKMQKLHSLKLINNNKLISIPESIMRAHGLIDLHIEGYESILVEEIKLEGHPSLISFVLIRAPHIRRLSLRGCRNLESIEIKNLDALEELDLSSTSINELPADIPNLPQLRRLFLLDVPSLRRFPWHKLQQLPDVFYLDQCSEGSTSHPGQVSQVCVSDPRLFCSFNGLVVDLVRDGKFFQSFYVCVMPCITNSKRRHEEEEVVLDSKFHELLQKQLAYMDVYDNYHVEEVATAPHIRVPMHKSKRHVDIIGMQQPITGLHDLLNVSKAVSVTCDTSIEYFSKLSNFVELEECEICWCPRMEGVFGVWTKDLEKLRNMHVSKLKSLVQFCSSHYMAFNLLAHLHLEYCPRLEYVLPYTTTLPCLKTLDIMFCYNLKKIFISSWLEVDNYQLPSLQKIQLQELPLLQHIDDNVATIGITAPMWTELHVRGCWSLQCLPPLQEGQPEAVKVNGEKSWWSKLQWGSLSHRDSYEPKLPPKFASFNEHVQMSSYLI